MVAPEERLQDGVTVLRELLVLHLAMIGARCDLEEGTLLPTGVASDDVLDRVIDVQPLGL